MTDLSPPPETRNLAEWLRRLKQDEGLSEDEIGQLLDKHGISPWHLVRACIASADGPDEVWAAMHSSGPEDSLSVISLHRSKSDAQSAVEDSKDKHRKRLRAYNKERKEIHSELDHPDDYDPTQTWEEYTRHKIWDVQKLTVSK